MTSQTVKPSPSAEHDLNLVQFTQQQDFDGRPVGGWYWTDEETSAPVGPFASLDAAQADHRDMLTACATCNGDGESGAHYDDGSPQPCGDCRGNGGRCA
jgi:hypothetical protein